MDPDLLESWDQDGIVEADMNSTDANRGQFSVTALSLKLSLLSS